MWYCFLHDFVIDFFHDIIHNYAITDIVMTDNVMTDIVMIDNVMIMMIFVDD